MMYYYKDYVTIEEIIGNDSHRYLLTAKLKECSFNRNIVYPRFTCFFRKAML